MRKFILVLSSMAMTPLAFGADKTFPDSNSVHAYLENQFGRLDKLPVLSQMNVQGIHFPVSSLDKFCAASFGEGYKSTSVHSSADLTVHRGGSYYVIGFQPAGTNPEGADLALPGIGFSNNIGGSVIVKTKPLAGKSGDTAGKLVLIKIQIPPTKDETNLPPINPLTLAKLECSNLKKKGEDKTRTMEDAAR
ncbi:MAG: hypothetical protein AB7G93_21645 [Bdellovibrionales bacterium]